MELILSALGEETATGLHQKHDSQGYAEIEHDVIEAGDTAAIARRAVEQRLGEPVVSKQNFLPQSKAKKQLSQPQKDTIHEPESASEQDTLF